MSAAISEIFIAFCPLDYVVNSGWRLGGTSRSTSKGRIQLWTDRMGIGPKYRESKLRGLKLEAHNSPF